MALKDWKKVSTNKWNNKDLSTGKSIVISKEQIFVENKEPQNQWKVTLRNRFSGRRQFLGLAKKKSQALKFAKDYMRSH